MQSSGVTTMFLHKAALSPYTVDDSSVEQLSVSVDKVRCVRLRRLFRSVVKFSNHDNDF